ncbi:CoA pyrophosphatase [Azorhizobium doebereinerae]|uniref:CoA pyrophosphatase n=1 Tax=Azorhizobium doebereinerae TaxID=281091 RepID=UPI000421FF5B|nr:CoA pyrophosphatase [Azorhizobium doebereinerae]
MTAPLPQTDPLPQAEPLPSALDDFLARAAARLSRVPPAPYAPLDHTVLNGDHAISGHVPVPEQPPRPAAVLVPVVARPEPTVLLTLRATTLSHHAGQIAFPGGRMDPGDADEAAAALREAREEVGLAADLIRPLGFLDGYLSSTNFWIVPVVGLVAPDYALTINEAEVQEAFEVPLAFLMSPGNHQRQSLVRDGVLRHFFAMPYEQHFIWGVTAGLIRNLYERVYA